MPRQPKSVTEALGAGARPNYGSVVSPLKLQMRARRRQPRNVVGMAAGEANRPTRSHPVTLNRGVGTVQPSQPLNQMEMGTAPTFSEWRAGRSPGLLSRAQALFQTPEHMAEAQRDQGLVMNRFGKWVQPPSRQQRLASRNVLPADERRARVTARAQAKALARQQRLGTSPLNQALAGQFGGQQGGQVPGGVSPVMMAMFGRDAALKMAAAQQANEFAASQAALDRQSREGIAEGEQSMRREIAQGQLGAREEANRLAGEELNWTKYLAARAQAKTPQEQAAVDQRFAPIIGGELGLGGTGVIPTTLAPEEAADPNTRISDLLDRIQGQYGRSISSGELTKLFADEGITPSMLEEFVAQRQSESPMVSMTNPVDFLAGLAGIGGHFAFGTPPTRGAAYEGMGLPGATSVADLLSPSKRRRNVRERKKAGVVSRYLRGRKSRQ